MALTDPLTENIDMRDEVRRVGDGLGVDTLASSVPW